MKDRHIFVTIENKIVIDNKLTYHIDNVLYWIYSTDRLDRLQKEPVQ